MTNISIVYFSGTGHTAKMAEAIAKGVSAVAGTQVQVLPIQSEEIQNGRFKNDSLMAKLDASDAVIFGSPTYMGGPSGQFKCFADATGERWFKSAWRDKLAAGFTVSGGRSGDKLSTLHYFFTLAMQHGMMWVGQAMTEPPEVAPNEADKLTGASLGRRIAEAAARWKRGAL